MAYVLLAPIQLKIRLHHSLFYPPLTNKYLEGLYFLRSVADPSRSVFVNHMHTGFTFFYGVRSVCFYEYDFIYLLLDHSLDKPCESRYVPIRNFRLFYRPILII